MTTCRTSDYIQATADAAQLLFGLRLRYSSEIPIAVWKMMAHAEAGLNREIDHYFRDSESEPSLSATA
jgi:hypothetical protein